jgi:glutamate N-acetyltransferase / amino-acid N-acetyltransferase
MSKTVSPLAPKSFPTLPALEGIRIATAEAGIRYKNRTDVLYVTLPKDTTVAGVFTRSKCPSAPVDWCRKNLGKGMARALVVNSGNANAFTGKKGAEAVKLTADIAAEAAGCRVSQVFIASTGVIGEPLDATKFGGVLAACEKKAKPTAWLDAAKAIMTTDTFPKVATATVDFDGVPVTIAGIAKGSGMIAPDMATMLSFVFTDAPISPPVLQRLLQPQIERSFNAITVDSDTSTSDTCLVFATGKAGITPIVNNNDPRATIFAEALGDVLHELAMWTVRDGEGATKLVTVNVTGATSDKSAVRIAQSIANSPLVKTAIAGEDANWGRIVMAVGKAGEPADRDKLSIAFGDFTVAEHGERSPGYDEAATSAYMKSSELEIRVDIGLGSSSATVYTCDLTHGYIDINGSYRS